MLNTLFERVTRSPAVATLGLLVAGMSVALYFRTYPATLPVVKKWASDSVRLEQADRIRIEVEAEAEQLSPKEKEARIDERLQAVLKDEQGPVSREIERRAQATRDILQNDEGQTYLLGIDPYHYLRQARNIVETGRGADEVRNGTPWNTYKLAPVGVAQETLLHEIISARLFNIVKFFRPGAKLFNLFFWMPVLVSVWSVVPAFFIARRKGGRLAGFAGSMLVGLNAAFLSRTVAGFSDTDAYNVTFPLFIAWVFLETLLAKGWKSRSVCAVTTGLLTGIYSKTWHCWWYMFDLILLIMIAHLGFNILRACLEEKSFVRAIAAEKTRRSATIIAMIVLSSGLFVSLFAGLHSFLSAPLSFLPFTAMRQAATASLWPLVFTTIGELEKISMQTVLARMAGGHSGAVFYFSFAYIGVILSMLPTGGMKRQDGLLVVCAVLILAVVVGISALDVSPLLHVALLLVPVAAGLVRLLKDNRVADASYAVFLSVWFVVSVYVALQGSRFALLLVPAYCVALGVFIGQAYRITRNLLESTGKRVWTGRAVFVVIVSALLVHPVVMADRMAESRLPVMNDAWWRALTGIRKESAPDAVITSWWDYGHWFKAVADRRVIFDGSVPNTPIAHWVGRALSTSNEKEAVGILRMLGCGSGTAFDRLSCALQRVDSAADVEPETIIRARAILDEILVIDDRSEAVAKLAELAELDIRAAEEIAELTHGRPPENYLITSGDMIEKAGAWGHFGIWDFKRAYVSVVLAEQEMDRAVPVIARILDTSREDAVAIYSEAVSLRNDQAATWISPWPCYVAGPGDCSVAADHMFCPFDAELQMQEGEIIRLIGALVDTNDFNRTSLMIRCYSEETGEAMYEEVGPKPRAVHFGTGTSLVEHVFAADPMETTELDLVIWPGATGYRALVASHEISASMFTRLFFMGGMYTSRFEKRAHENCPIKGDTIIVWKVKQADR